MPGTDGASIKCVAASCVQSVQAGRVANRMLQARQMPHVSSLMMLLQIMPLKILQVSTHASYQHCIQTC